ncbi:hypothetical protein HPG69_015245 [Diceros bicornis minor]|uniref:Uncharacterized protein n=1 Tax=Diceros bicornis minor TaxID=77932 RepID=A0A7J7EIN6_DICBM|nr:hypothetical protein HPG69_015245 [Diceros bicornis minor]
MSSGWTFRTGLCGAGAEALAMWSCWKTSWGRWAPRLCVPSSQ